MSLNVWFLSQIDDLGRKSVLEVSKKKKPLDILKEEKYSENDKVQVEERKISMNQDLTYFGFLLGDVSAYLTYYLDSFLDISNKEHIEEFQDMHKWAVSKLIERKSEISRLSHMISQNNLSDVDNLYEKMNKVKISEEEFSMVRCLNQNCSHWKQSQGDIGICLVKNPRINVEGQCISIVKKNSK